MKTLQKIETQIVTLTTSIEVNYPELYDMLDENPITIPAVIRPKMSISIMEDYLESLKQILQQYIKTHKKI
jgi:SUMO ligase MMS21 Smc5/6 complex component